MRTIAVHSEATQLRLPLFRATSPRSGLLYPNSQSTERRRRYAARHLAMGAAVSIAEELGARPARIHDELEGRVLLSADVLTAALARLDAEPRLELLGDLAGTLGLAVALLPNGVL